MANSNSTRTTKTPAEAEQKAFAAMLCHSEDKDEAVTSVSNVIRFMSRAMAACGSDIVDGEVDGARIILETCADTLDSHFATGGAA